MDTITAQIDPRIPVITLARALATEGLVIRHNPETQQLYITETDETRAVRERREELFASEDMKRSERARHSLLERGMEP